MGSPRTTQVAPPPPPKPHVSIVCCMCGDRGLPGELFRCKLCFFRSQHKYCSELYPKAETYKACNWCLREDKSKPILYSGPSVNVGGGFEWKMQRGAPPPLQLSKPVKKQRDVPPELSPAVEGGRVRQSFRGKVRRYKLLDEVSS